MLDEIYRIIVDLLTTGTREMYLDKRYICKGENELSEVEDGMALCFGADVTAFIPKETVLHTAILKAW